MTRSSARTRIGLLRAVAAGGMLGLAITLSAAWHQICARPLDVTASVRSLFGKPPPAPPAGAWRAAPLAVGTPDATIAVAEWRDARERPPPAWLDGSYFFAHASVASVLDRASCAPDATGTQWLKAAIHARSAEDVQRTGAGMARTLARSAAPEALARLLCSEASPRNWEPWDQVVVALALAGVRCG